MLQGQRRGHGAYRDGCQGRWRGGVDLHVELHHRRETRRVVLPAVGPWAAQLHPGHQRAGLLRAAPVA